MKETVNFGFKKPESTDFVDVGVFGENFDKIDEAITPYRISTGKDHDFSFAAGEEDNISVLNLTELLGDSAVEIIAAFDMGRPVVVSVADSANEFEDVSVVLTQKTVYGTSTTLTGMAVNPLQVNYNTVMRFELHLTPDEDSSYIVKLHIMDHMTSGTGGGSVPEQLATSAHVVKADGKVTITERMEDGTDSVTVIEYDENEVPTKITTNGHVLPITWEGF